MIIDSDGNQISPPHAPWMVKVTWLASFVALIVGVAAVAAFAVWMTLILVPLGLVAAGIAGIYYRVRLSRYHKSMVVHPGWDG